jgi:hypothetical protein
LIAAAMQRRVECGITNRRATTSIARRGIFLFV